MDADRSSIVGGGCPPTPIDRQLSASRWAPAQAQIGAPPGPEHTAVPTPAPVTSAEVDRWRADLETLATELEARHADLFHSVSAETFRSSVTSLRDRIPTLARHEIVVGMMRIVASVGDGHTSVPVLFDAAAGFHALPLRLGLYEEGLDAYRRAYELDPAVGRAAEVLCRETGRLPNRTSCGHP